MMEDLPVCWYCRWGWPKAVADIYDRHGNAGDLDWGPAHVVWADENFDDDVIRACLRECDEWDARPEPGDGDNTDHYLSAVARASLIELLAVPESVRIPRPDYDESPHDGRSVEDFPPPPEIEMVTGP
jgi:hypothetical protein